MYVDDDDEKIHTIHVKSTLLFGCLRIFFPGQLYARIRRKSKQMSILKFAKILYVYYIQRKKKKCNQIFHYSQHYFGILLRSIFSLDRVTFFVVVTDTAFTSTHTPSSFRSTSPVLTFIHLFGWWRYFVWMVFCTFFFFIFRIPLMMNIWCHCTVA